MDPYLETRWGGVHHSLIQYSRDALQPQLPDDLLADIEERVYVESAENRRRSIIPDARVFELKAFPSLAGSVLETNGIAVAEPRIFLEDEAEITEGSIQIREASGDRVITVIEFLSPANKSGGEGTRLYRQKQDEILRSDTSLVEIDLVRAGRRVLILAAYRIPEELRHDSLACIRRAWKPYQTELYNFPLREGLRALPIPLREGEPPIPLDLQAILDQCYQNGRYHTLDYAKPPDPLLRPEDAEWAEEILKAAGRR